MTCTADAPAPALSPAFLASAEVKIRQLSDDDLTQLLDQVADREELVALILSVLDERDATRDDHAPATAADERRAYLEDYRETDSKGRREPIVKAADRLYGDLTRERWEKAEEACNGQLLTPQGRSTGVDSYSLFHGNASRAVKWASDELLAWWEENGRTSWAEHMYEYTGHARYASDAARARGQWVEYLRKGRDRRRAR